MSVKIKMKENKMAVVRFTNPVDKQYFEHLMLMARDNKQPHPPISIKNKEGELPPIKPPEQKPGVQMPQKLTPEMMEQLKKQGMAMPPRPVLSKEPKLVKAEDVKINVEDVKEKIEKEPFAKEIGKGVKDFDNDVVGTVNDLLDETKIQRELMEQKDVEKSDKPDPGKKV